MQDSKFDLIVAGGMLVSETSVHCADICIRAGRVACLAAPGQIDKNLAHDVLDATGKHVMPGAIDPHFHAGELQISHREDFGSGTRAAAAGGYTTLIEMPLSVPPVADFATFTRKLTELKRKAVIDCALWGAIIPGNINELPALRKAGVSAFKAFMTSVPEYPRVTDEELCEAMIAIDQLGGLVGVHAENEAIICAESARLRALGRSDFAATAEARPPEAELAAIHTALAMARVTHSPIHIVHASIPESVSAVVQAQSSGQDATVETCPHYLTFTIDDLRRLGPIVKCGPPLRNAVSREGLWRQVLTGGVDMIGSDHTPATTADKSTQDDPWNVSPGIQGIQSVLSVLLTEGVHIRGLTLPSLVRLVSGNPARRFGLFPQKGSLHPGADADIVLIDLGAEWTLHKSDLKSKHQWSPYVGKRFRGRVIATLVRGRIVFRAGEIEAEGGYGQWLPVWKPPLKRGDDSNGV